MLWRSKTHEEQKMCLKICLFGFPQSLVMGSVTTAAQKVVSSSTLIGPFQIWTRAKIQQPLMLTLKIQTGSLGWQKRHSLLRKCERLHERKLVCSQQRSLLARNIKRNYINKLKQRSMKSIKCVNMMYIYHFLFFFFLSRGLGIKCKSVENLQCINKYLINIKFATPPFQNMFLSIKMYSASINV